MTLQIGQILDGKYRILRELGAGAMGAVYEGENVRIHRRVAIKVLLPGVADDSATVQRFEREAQAAGRIGSEHIVEVLDLGSMHDGGYFMVMEFLEGLTLSERIRSRGRLTPRELVPIAQQLLTGLEAAHQAHIIHRDLKPDNVFLVADHSGQTDFVKVLDFGVSKFSPLNNDGMSMTRTGTVVGTPFYMAPEQAKGSRDVDQRVDLYSVGVILYEAVTGQVPFNAATFNELIFKIVLQTPAPPEHYVPDLDPAFSRLIRRAMAREPQDRFATAAEFRDALSVWLHTGDDGNDALVPPPTADEDQQMTMLASSPQDAAAAFDGRNEDVVATQYLDAAPVPPGGWQEGSGRPRPHLDSQPHDDNAATLHAGLEPFMVPAGAVDPIHIPGVERRSPAMVAAMVAGAVLVTAAGAGAGVLLLQPNSPGEAAAHVSSEDVHSPATDTTGEAADPTEAAVDRDDGDAPDELGEGDTQDAETPAPTPVPAKAATAARSTATGTAKTAQPRRSGSPAPPPPPSKAGDQGGRRINTEL